MKLSKKVLATVLSALMVISMMPTFALTASAKVATAVDVAPTKYGLVRTGNQSRGTGDNGCITNDGGNDNMSAMLWEFDLSAIHDGYDITSATFTEDIWSINNRNIPNQYLDFWYCNPADMSNYSNYLNNSNYRDSSLGYGTTGPSTYKAAFGVTESNPLYSSQHVYSADSATISFSNQALIDALTKAADENWGSIVFVAMYNEPAATTWSDIWAGLPKLSFRTEKSPSTPSGEDLVDKSALATPSFNTAAYYFNDVATGAYSNVVYTSSGSNGMYGVDNYSEAGATYIKLFVPKTVVLAYDGVHKVSSPIVAETKIHDKAAVSGQKISYIASKNGTVYFDKQWDGFSGSSYEIWPTATDNHFGYLTSDGRSNEYDARNSASRFWKNELVYHGSGNTTSYYDDFSNLAFEGGAYYSNWGDKFGTTEIVTNSEAYVINYKPIYDILDDARDLADEINANAWMYTDASLNQAVSALNAVGECNPYNYEFSVSAGASVQRCATDIKNAREAYDSINLVKKTFTATFKTAAGGTIEARQVTAGEELGALPANTAGATHIANTNTHSVYTWEGVVTADTVITDNAEFTETTKAENCTFTAGAHTDATTEENGYTTYACECGNSYKSYDALNFDAYNTAVSKAEALMVNEDYTADSRTAYAQAVEAAKLTEAQKEDEKLPPATIAAAVTAIEDAKDLLEAVPVPENTYNLEIEDTVEVNFNIDTGFYDAQGGTVVVEHIVTTDENGDITVAKASYEVTAADTGKTAIEMDVAPAQIAEPFVIKVYKAGSTEPEETITTSIQDYCQTIMDPANGFDEKDVAVAKALLNYGALANEYFGYAVVSEAETGEAYAVANTEDWKDAVNAESFKAKAKCSVVTGTDASGNEVSVTGVSYLALLDPEFRFYVSQENEVWAALTSVSVESEEATGLEAKMVKTENGFCVRVTGLKASDFGKKFTVTIGTYKITYNGYAFLYTALKDADTDIAQNTPLQNLAKGVYRYAAACEAKFA